MIIRHVRAHGEEDFLFGEPRRQAFSAMELLVVITVMSVLSSFLLTGVSRAKETARRAICMSNLRRIGVATHMYAENNNGWLPITADSDLRSTNVLWDGSAYQKYGHLWETGFLTADDIFYCDSADGTDPVTKFKKDNPNRGGKNRGVASKISASSYYQRGIPEGAPQKLTDSAGETKALIADYQTKNPVQTGGYVDWTHTDGANVLYSDFHVKFVSGRWDVKYADDYGGDQGQNDSFWTMMDQAQ